MRGHLPATLFGLFFGHFSQAYIDDCNPVLPKADDFDWQTPISNSHAPAQVPDSIYKQRGESGETVRPDYLLSWRTLLDIYHIPEYFERNPTKNISIHVLEERVTNENSDNLLQFTIVIDPLPGSNLHPAERVKFVKRFVGTTRTVFADSVESKDAMSRTKVEQWTFKRLYQSYLLWWIWSKMHTYSMLGANLARRQPFYQDPTFTMTNHGQAMVSFIGQGSRFEAQTLQVAIDLRQFFIGTWVVPVRLIMPSRLSAHNEEELPPYSS